MKTNQLIDALANDAGAVQPHILERRIAIAVVAGLTFAFILMAVVFGFREDFRDAFVAVLLKAGFGVAAAAAVVPLLLEVARPNTNARRAFRPAVLFAAASVALAVISFLLTPADSRTAAWFGGGGVPECLYRIPLLAAPIAIALFFAVSELGPTRLSLAGAAIGGVSGGLASIAYAACCPMDSMLYVASWYLAAILFCAAIGSIVIGRALRW